MSSPGLLVAAWVCCAMLPGPVAAAQSRPAQSRPAQSRPAQSRPAQPRPAQSRPAQPRPRASSAEADPAAVLDRAVAAAEASLRDGERQLAESRYRDVLREAWMTRGELHLGAGRLADARDAFRRATTSAVDAVAAFQSLALVHLQMGEAAAAVGILTKLAGRNPRDLQTKRVLAQALIANGEHAEAVQTLEEALAAAPDDPELAFLLASGYLHAKKVEAAERLFARVIAARPIPETHVLIGRTYRDFGLYDRARAALVTALRKDPTTRRAHYYLGTLAVLAEGVVRLDEAIAEFRTELKLAPEDPITNLRLGMALVEGRRPAEALRSLEIASRAPGAGSDVLHYLGRCLLALGRPADAAAAFKQALDRSQTARPGAVRRGDIHYQLAVALRSAGAPAEAAAHFAEAEKASAERADADREQLARYLADAPGAAGGEAIALPFESPLAALSSVQRAELERRAVAALARSYLNLGVMQAQAQRFSRAVELLADAAAVAPDFPQVQYSLGVASFSAQQYEQAIAPLERALAADPANADVQRMLALALLNAERYDRAAALLAADPRRRSDPPLQYAYGLALARSERPSDAEAVFAELLAAHGATAELSVLMGQAHAQQGDYEKAIQELVRALQIDARVAQANATLGLIYLKQGKLAEARAALRAELQVHPADAKAAHTLATVLDLDGESDEAVRMLRSLLASRPDFANARYLLGKILLARGLTEEAIAHLEAGVRLAPDDANIHYQLAQAYLKAGRTELAERQLEAYREIKDRRRSP